MGSSEPRKHHVVAGYHDDVAEPDEDADGDTIPRSRLRAARDQPPPEPPVRVRDAPEPARPAVRSTGSGLEQRIAPWAVPPAPQPGEQASVEEAEGDPAAATAGTPESPPRRRSSRHRPDRHAAYAPPEGAVDLEPSRPTPLADPPRRRFWRWRRPR